MNMSESRLEIISLILFIFLILTYSCKDKQAASKEVEIVESNQTKAPIKSTESNKKTILCFGNSLTAGLGLDEDQAWPMLLQNRLDSLGYKYNVINAGLSGETTSGGLNRIDWVLNQNIDVFILELGANDMLRGLDINHTSENLEKILEKVHQKFPGLPIVIAGMLAPPNMGSDYTEKFSKMYTTLAQKYNGHLIPFLLNNVAGIDSLNLADRKHPNSLGQKIVLDNVWLALKEAL